MDSSPEPTVIVRALKDFDQFLSSGSKSREMLQGSTRRLNFSHDRSNTSSLLEGVGGRTSMGFSSKKRPLDSLVGFDVTKKFREKESEVVSTRAEVARLEGRLREAEVRYKTTQLERDKELESLRAKQRRDKEMIDDLQHKLKKSQGQMKEMEKGVERNSAESSSTSLDVQSKMLAMQRDHMQECNKMRQEVEELRERVLLLEKEAEEKNAKVELAESYAKELEVEVEEGRPKIREARNTQQLADSLQAQLDQTRAKLKALESREEGMTEAEGHASVFQTAIRKLPQLEKDVARLKDDNKFLRDTGANSQLLEEKMIGAQQQIARLEQRCRDMALLQADLQSAQAQLAKFESLGKEELELSRAATPEDLRSHLAKLRSGDRSITDNLSQLRTSLRSHEESREALEAEVRRLREKLEREQRSTQQNAVLVKRLQRKLLLVSKEREGLKNVLSSYEAELTINHSAVSQERTRRLDEQLTLYREEVKRLEGELETAGGSSGNKAYHPPQLTRQRPEDVEKIHKLQDKIQEKEQMIKDLEEKMKEREEKVREAESRTREVEEKVREGEVRVKELEGEKEVLELRLEARALKGDYDPTKTKILHFKNNPLSMALEGRGTELERMQEEIEGLRERIRLMEAGDTHNITQKVGMNVAQSSQTSKEVTDLQEQVDSLESRNKRMMEAFKRKSLEMREVVYRLTGYRVDTSGNNQYKLIHMYAESPEDYLHFEQTRNKELQLLETDFSKGLDDLIDAYLHHESSYPAFLSAVTLDLFNRQTNQVEEEEEEEVEEQQEQQQQEEQELHILTDDDNSGDSQTDDNDDLVILD